jgi:hypothetical protein
MPRVVAMIAKTRGAVRRTAVQVAVGLASTVCGGCASVAFNSVQDPNLAPMTTAAGQLTAPTPPTAQKLAAAEPQTIWSVVDLTNKAPLRRKLMAVRVTLDRPPQTDKAAAQANSGMLTASLLARLMAAGFGSVQDLSTAPRVTAQVERTGPAGNVTLSGTLADVVPVAAPLRADNVLSVRFVVLPAASMSQSTRYTIGEDLLAAYEESQKQYVAAMTSIIAQLDAAFDGYARAFRSSRADYEKRGGGYSSFPSKSTGQVALERYEEVEKQYRSVRARLQAKQTALPAADRLRAAAASRMETISSVRERVVAVATLHEQGSNRVLWLGESDSTSESGEGAVVALINDLPGRLPTEKRGAR